MFVRLTQLVRSLTANKKVLGSIPDLVEVELWGPSFATPSIDREIKPLVWSLNVLSGDLKEPLHLSIRVG